MIEIILLLFLLGLSKFINCVSSYENKQKAKAYNEKITQEQVLKKRAKGYSEQEIQDYIERRKRGLKY